MIVSHDWLRGFVPHERSAADVGELLGRHCVTLDGLTPLRVDLAPFVVGLVVEAAPHPDSDHLSVTRVDDGSGTLLDVVCGAPNVTAGHKYPFARTGTTMPDGLVIARRKIRGATSNGMLCSARELGLGEEHDGIYTLETDAAPGTPLLDVLPVGDVRLELDVLPNRPDLLSHLGVAREVSALTGLPLRMPAELPPLPGPEAVQASVTGEREATADGVTIRLEDQAACPRYVGIVIRDLTVGPSPAWLVERLRAVGARSINNVVDATNYVLHALGQPVHAFDLRMLAGRRIVVRPTRDGESLVTLDGVQRALPAGTTLICDGERPTALAGIMGGEASEVSASTTDVLLEVAWFDPTFVRAVRKQVQLSTDASYRFERGVDAGFTGKAAGYAASLIAAVAGGRITAVLDVGVAPPGPLPVRLRAARVAHLLGVAVPVADIERTLVSIGCMMAPDGDGAWLVTPPTWRRDLHLEIDLIEEVARLLGFDSLPEVIQPFRPSTVPDDPLHVASRRVRDVCVEFGLAETRPMPFVPTASDESLRVRNPLAEDEPYLRESLLTTLATRAEYNLARMQGNIRLFEIGAAFVPVGERLPREEVRVGALLMGASRPPHFTEPDPPPFDAWDAKALAEAIAHTAFPRQTVRVEPAEQGALWEILVGDAHRPVGRVVEVALDRPVWASAAFGVELTLGVMPSADVAPARQHAHDPSARPPRVRSPLADVRVRPLPSFPAASFDMALLVPVELPAARVEAVLRGAAGDLLESLVLFDAFRGEGVPAGHRSLAWRLTFRHPERTLRDKEIDGRRSGLLKTLDRELGVRPRAT
jgi:phenylalanyl-tRNA synthetase beta chain